MPAQPDALNPLPAHPRVHAIRNRFDFRKFGHLEK
jgi:hypothetical protein